MNNLLIALQAFWEEYGVLLLEGIRDTLYMTLLSTFFGYIIGLPMGIVLTLTDKEAISPNRIIYTILTIFATIICYFILVKYNDQNPIFDSITTIFSVLGLLLTVKRCIEQWHDCAQWPYASGPHNRPSSQAAWDLRKCMRRCRPSRKRLHTSQIA